MALPERARRDRDPVEDALLLGRAAARLRRGPPSRASRRPRARPRASRRARTHLGQVRLFALHREDAVGDEELEARGRVLRRASSRAPPRSPCGTRKRFAFAQAHAVDDRGVVELVRVEPVRLVEDRGEEALVGRPAGHVEDRVVGAEEGGDLRLELLVELLRAADEADGPEARAPAVDRLLLRLADARVVGEAEVVVRGQHHDLAAADLHARAPAPTGGRAPPCRCRPAGSSAIWRRRDGRRERRHSPSDRILPGDAVARKGRVERGERAVERRRVAGHDLGAERRRAHELRGPRRAAHDDRVRRALRRRRGSRPPPRAPARRSAPPSRSRRACRHDAREAHHLEVVRLELGAVPVLPDAAARDELEAVGDVGEARLLDRELGDAASVSSWFGSGFGGLLVGMVRVSRSDRRRPSSLGGRRAAPSLRGTSRGLRIRS